MTSTWFHRFVAGTFCVLSIGATQAHVSLEQRSAPAGSSYKATLRIGHGCDGSATTLVRVFVPDAMRGAKPMPKPGWTLTAPRVPLAQPYELHGKRISDNVREITWRGGPLPHDWVDEFSFVATLPSTPGPLAIRVLQECESGRIEWFDTAPPGEKAPRWPAAIVEVLPADNARPHH
jgi:periplasmic copper chaperone A